MGMIAELLEVRVRLAAVAEEFDPATVSAADAERVLGEARRIANAANALARQAGNRAADAGRARDGDRDPESWLGRKTGTTKTKARAALATEKKLQQLPQVAEAARQGELSPEQTEAIADAASADPSAEAELVAAARRLPLPKLQEQCRRVKAGGDPNPENTYARLREARRLVMWGDVDGGFHLLMDSTGDDGCVVRAALGQLGDELWARAQARGDNLTRQQLAADALVTLCQRYLDAYETARQHRTRRAQPAPAPDDIDDTDLLTDHPQPPTSTSEGGATTSGAGTDDDDDAPDIDGGGVDGPPPTPEGEPGRAEASHEPVAPPAPFVPMRRRKGKASKYLGILRLDVTALQRGRPVAGEVVEIAGVGPIPVSVARRFLGDAVLKLVITRGVDVLNVTHLGRGPSAAQQVALLWGGLSCTDINCPAPATEYDHRHGWATTKVTELRHLDPLCDHHHDLKTFHGWALIEGTAPRPMVPPDDPRHPNNSSPP